MGNTLWNGLTDPIIGRISLPFHGGSQLPRAVSKNYPYPYFNISAPRDLVLRLERLVKQNPELGYQSASQAAIEGIRRITQELEARVAASRLGTTDLKDGTEEAVQEMITLIMEYFQSKKDATRAARESRARKAPEK